MALINVIALLVSNILDKFIFNAAADAVDDFL